MPEIRALVLASASPRRLELLRSLGLSVEVAPSGYGEIDPPGTAPRELAALHARCKLDDVAARLDARDDERAIVASDTVVDLDGVSLGKPQDAGDARRMLGMLSGREHAVHTAFAVRLPGGRGADGQSRRVRHSRARRRAGRVDRRRLLHGHGVPAGAVRPRARGVGFFHTERELAASYQSRPLLRQGGQSLRIGTSESSLR